MNEQRRMPMMARTEKPQPVPVEEVRQCHCLTDAIALCVQHSRYRKHYQIAELIGMNPAHFSRCLSGSHHFPNDKLTELMEVCGNLAPLQYLLMHFGMEQPALDEKEQRKQELLAELKELESNGDFYQGAG